MRLPRPAADWPESWLASNRYDQLELGPPNSGYARAYRRRQSVAFELVNLAAAPGATVIDVAAAQGNFSLGLAEQGYRVTWNDLRIELADYVRLKHEAGNLSFLPGEILTLAPSPYDVVLATEVIEHVAHPDLFLRHLTRLTRPGGHVVLTTPNGAYFRNRLPRFSDFADTSAFEAVQFRPDADGHIFLLDPGELREMAKQAGLEVVEVRPFSTPLTAGWLGSERLMPWLPDGAEVVRRLPMRIQSRVAIHLGALFRRTLEK